MLENMAVRRTDIDALVAAAVAAVAAAAVAVAVAVAVPEKTLLGSTQMLHATPQTHTTRKVQTIA